ncbi:MAG: 30S ribosomal protein S20 [Psychroflexus sp.]|jgi:small subunit ribosomal protein S20|nr:30S ribosomal protein S20 [Psychroflexus sp.]MDR9448319.1 30S ribosomal protein S20 [Psychroflexus sp.]
MANHKSSLKRIRGDKTKKERNRYQHKTTRSAIKDFKAIEKKEEAQKKLPEVFSMIDKLSKRNIVHSNKAARLKSSLARHTQSL